MGGTLMAIYLARAGYRVRVCERRPDPRAEGALGGRSINLALSTRGLHALDGAGLASAVLGGSVPMRGRMIHSVSGRQTFQPYGTRKSDAIHSVSRGGLNLTLLAAAGAEDDLSLEFDCRCVDLDPASATLTVENPTTGERRRVESDLVIGADGAFSRVRARLTHLDRFDFSQSYLAHGYKEMTIPAVRPGEFALEPNALHIWPRGGFMMIALPNRDGSFTCTLFWPFEGPTGFAAMRDGDDVARFFSRWFADAVPLMPDLVGDFARHPVSSLLTVRCRPWFHQGTVALLGDACHAVVPFYGQGANAAFEDCVFLDAALRDHPGDPARAFAVYDAQRREQVNVLADLALRNFIEMRDRTASHLFLARKALERGLHRLAPRLFVPLYSMATFSRRPYGDAVRRARWQWIWVCVLAGAGLALLAGAMAWALSSGS
ncbi:MAG: FAD-dependent oxidoreductase [Acidobacteriota bacterium]